MLAPKISVLLSPGIFATKIRICWRYSLSVVLTRRKDPVDHPEIENGPSLFVPPLALAEYFIASLARGISSPRGFASITLRKPEENCDPGTSYSKKVSGDDKLTSYLTSSQCRNEISSFRSSYLLQFRRS